MGITSVYFRDDLAAEKRSALNSWARLLRLIATTDDFGRVEEHLRPKADEDDQRALDRREEFRRMIRADGETWAKYIACLANRSAGDNVARIA